MYRDWFVVEHEEHKAREELEIILLTFVVKNYSQRTRKNHSSFHQLVYEFRNRLSVPHLGSPQTNILHIPLPLQ